MDYQQNVHHVYPLNRAESAGKRIVKVDPRGTTQQCSVCGTIVPKALSERTHNCPYCGVIIPRDFNSAKNVLFRGLSTVGVGWGTPEPSTVKRSSTLAEIRAYTLADAGAQEQALVTEARIPYL